MFPFSILERCFFSFSVAVFQFCWNLRVFSQCTTENMNVLTGSLIAIGTLSLVIIGASTGCVGGLYFVQYAPYTVPPCIAYTLFRIIRAQRKKKNVTMAKKN